MLTDLIAYITPFIQHHGAWGVFVISVIEEVIAPIPSSFALLAAGFFLLPSYDSFSSVLFQSIFKVVIPGGLGLAVGSMFIYAIVYLEGEPIIKKYGKWFGIHWSDVEKINNKMKQGKADEWILFGLRALPIVPNIAVSAMCGLIKYPAKRYFVITFFGSALRAFLMGILGWSLGEAYVIYAGQIEEFGAYVFYACIAIFVLWITYFFIKKILKKRRKKEG
ncbi:hypothetical protein C4565_10350 [Candidatus Parcubacteria bacterium]|jgi:membrane protein DedA with SNARE-associated domain|nr:MAG: hypothetical protein C4565_10350 [Candidatus Parcubacteria bacterium]